MIFLIWAAVLLTALVLYIRQKYSRFSEYGVSHFTPIPLVGNMASAMRAKEHVAGQFENLYHTFPEDRFSGRYEILKPVVVVRDLDLIKNVTVKDFEYFLDHRTFVDDTVDPFFGRNLFSLRGQEWKDMRSTLSPVFTSLKMRQMVPFMIEVNEQLIKNVKKQIQQSEQEYIDVDCKDLTTRYTNDVIASCAFGVKVDSHSDQNNDFYVMGKTTATFGFKRILIFLGYSTIPFIMKILNIKLFSDTSRNFFKSLVLGSMKERELHQIIRPDMIHFLMEAKKGKLSYEEKASSEGDTGFAAVEESDVGKKTVLRSWSDNDLTAQAILFYIAGYETVSSAMSFMLHELAVNPDVQEKLYQEIKNNAERTEGKFDYNSIQNLKYLDMVISEVLRLWPPAVGLDRLCVKDYNLGRANKNSPKDYIMRKGEALTIPIWSMHRNPDYFPNPLKFDPERFSDENKHNIKPFTYLPFGSGPRNCIGSRFALCEIKVMAYQLIQNFEVSPCAKTRIPAELSPKTFNLLIKGGHWIRIKLRK